MPLKFIDIRDSQVKFVNEEKNPENRLGDAEISLGNVLFENAMEKVRVNGIEAIQGDLMLEIAQLKMGGNA